MQRRQAGFTFIEILVVMSIIVVLAGMVAVAVPWMQERGRQTESISNVKNLVTLLAGRAMDKRTWPPYDGKGFTLSLVATNDVDIRNRNNLKTFFSPGDRRLLFDTVEVARYKEVTQQALRSGGADFHELTSYAGRRNHTDEFVVTPDKESMVVPVICDDDFGNLHHPKGLVMGFTDGASRFVEWADLDMPPPEEVDNDVEPFLGDDASVEELRGLASE